MTHICFNGWGEVQGNVYTRVPVIVYHYGNACALAKYESLLGLRLSCDKEWWGNFMRQDQSWDKFSLAPKFKA